MENSQKKTFLMLKTKLLCWKKTIFGPIVDHLGTKDMRLTFLAMLIFCRQWQGIVKIPTLIFGIFSTFQSSCEFMNIVGHIRTLLYNFEGTKGQN